MTEFVDPLKMVRSVYSHVDSENHEINLADDSKRRWFGFSCVGCNDEYVTWQCSGKALGCLMVYEHPGEDQLLLKLVSTQAGRISIRDALNRLVQFRVTAKIFSQMKSNAVHASNPLDDPSTEVEILEDMLMDDAARLTTSSDKTLINSLKTSFRNNIPSRYNRRPVI